jgi:predicted transcriptional regulator
VHSLKSSIKRLNEFLLLILFTMKKQVVLDFELDELFDRLMLIEKIEKGKEDIRTGNVITHEQAKEKLGKWLK